MISHVNIYMQCYKNTGNSKKYTKATNQLDINIIYTDRNWRKGTSVCLTQRFKKKITVIIIAPFTPVISTIHPYWRYQSPGILSVYQKKMDVRKSKLNPKNKNICEILLYEELGLTIMSSVYASRIVLVSKWAFFNHLFKTV